jgi:hypothetical protein
MKPQKGAALERRRPAVIYVKSAAMLSCPSLDDVTQVTNDEDGGPIHYVPPPRTDRPPLPVWLRPCSTASKVLATQVRSCRGHDEVMARNNFCLTIGKGQPFRDGSLIFHVLL